MKIDRDLAYLEKFIAKNDFPSARTIIEQNFKKFSEPNYRSKLSLNALTFLNCILQLNEQTDKKFYSRETQLIIRHINKLAHECKLSELKGYVFLQKDLLSDPQVYNSLNEDAKVFIPKPKKTEEEVVTQNS